MCSCILYRFSLLLSVLALYWLLVVEILDYKLLLINFLLTISFHYRYQLSFLFIIVVVAYRRSCRCCCCRRWVPTTKFNWKILRKYRVQQPSRLLSMIIRQSWTLSFILRVLLLKCSLNWIVSYRENIAGPKMFFGIYRTINYQNYNRKWYIHRIVFG